MGGLWYSEEGPGWATAPPSPLIAVSNVTAHPSTASVPITVLLYDGPLLCGFNVANKRVKIQVIKQPLANAMAISFCLFVCLSVCLFVCRL